MNKSNGQKSKNLTKITYLPPLFENWSNIKENGIKTGKTWGYVAKNAET